MENTKSKNNISVSKSSQPEKNSFINFVTKYDSLVIFGGFAILVIITIILTGLFVAGPVVRDSLLYNIMGGFLLAIVFIYIIYNFMGHNLVILGKRFDFGMILYISIVLFVIFILGG